MQIFGKKFPNSERIGLYQSRVIKLKDEDIVRDLSVSLSFLQYDYFIIYIVLQMFDGCSLDTWLLFSPLFSDLNEQELEIQVVKSQLKVFVNTVHNLMKKQSFEVPLMLCRIIKIIMNRR